MDYYTPNQIVLANGAKQAITDIVFATIDEGDEAILLAPYWAAYEGILRMAGGAPVILHPAFRMASRYRPPASLMRLPPRTKLLFINSPNNPSGAYTLQQESGGDRLRPARPLAVLVISDEIYEYITLWRRCPRSARCPACANAPSP